jgi:hypothetical protein
MHTRVELGGANWGKGAPDLMGFVRGPGNVARTGVADSVSWPS